MKKKLAVLLCSAVMLTCMPMTSFALAGWQDDSNGYWYQYDDGSYPVSRWEKFRDAWYYFDETGYVKTGWFQYHDSWYYADKYGHMRTEPLHYNGLIYYFDENGACTNPSQTPDWEQTVYSKDDYLKAVKQWYNEYDQTMSDLKQWRHLSDYHKYDEIRAICDKARPVLEKPFRMKGPDSLSDVQRTMERLSDATSESVDVISLVIDNWENKTDFDTYRASDRYEMTSKDINDYSFSLYCYLAFH